MISSSSIPAPITAHKGQGRLRCWGRGSASIEHDRLVPRVIDFPIDDAIVDLIYDVKDTNVTFDVPIAYDVSIASDVPVASNVLVTIDVLIALDVPIAFEVQVTSDVPLDVYITSNVHASNVTYQRRPIHKRRAPPYGTWSLQLTIVL